MVVKENSLLAMNGVHMNVTTLSRIIGTALAGFLLTFMSLYGLYMSSFIAYGLLLVTTLLLQVDEKAHGTKRSTGGKRAVAAKGGKFMEMIPLLRGMPVVYTVLVLTFIPSLFIGGFNLMVIGVSELQHDPGVKGLLYTVEGTSFILGAFLSKRIISEKNKMKMLFTLAFLIAASQLSLVFADQKLASLASFGLFGLAAGAFFPIVATVFQTGVPKEYHGRFFSFRNMLDRILFQIVLLGTGALLDTIGMQRMALLFGIVSLLMAAGMTFRGRRLAPSAAQQSAVAANSEQG